MQSCGCLKNEAPKNKTHGARHTRAFSSWWNMKSRCERPNSRYYADYGGRGIKVCARWQDFGNFLSDMGQPPDGHTLEREDNNGNYEPGNVRWSDRKGQANNRRSNVFYEVDGVTKTLQQWADEVGLGRSTISARIKAGWPPEMAIRTPKLK